MITPLDITTYEFPYILEVLATIAWATSGALVARACGFDFVGVFIIALVSTTAGGLIRDGIFLQRIPVMLTDPLYLLLAFFASVMISIFGRYWEKVRRGDVVTSMIDALGTPAFALIGFQLAYLAGAPAFEGDVPADHSLPRWDGPSSPVGGETCDAGHAQPAVREPERVCRIL